MNICFIEGLPGYLAGQVMDVLDEGCCNDHCNYLMAQDFCCVKLRPKQFVQRTLKP